MSRSVLVAAAMSAAAVSLYSFASLAHVGLEPPQATANSTLTVGFRIGHGCGESPTTAVRISIPAGITAVQPQPKAGWNVATKTTTVPPAAGAAANTAPTVAVTEVNFTGGKLPHDFFDTFVLRFKVPNTPGTTVYFPVIQECEKGANRWVEPIVAGQPEPPQPMPGLRVVAP